MLGKERLLFCALAGLVGWMDGMDGYLCDVFKLFVFG